MGIRDINNLIKNGFSHDEILEIIRNGTNKNIQPETQKQNEEQAEAEENETENEQNNAYDQAIEELRSEQQKIKENYEKLIKRINENAVKESETNVNEPEKADIKKVMESLIK